MGVERILNLIYRTVYLFYILLCNFIFYSEGISLVLCNFKFQVILFENHNNITYPFNQAGNTIIYENAVVSCKRNFAINTL